MDLIAYIRVSKVAGREGDSFQSPGQQRKAIQAIVALTPNARIIQEYEDLDESGGTMNRPGVQAAVAAVESGQADGIVCAYLDRWARTVEALEMIEQWALQGKTFISARERFDATTSQGKFALGMMLLVAKYYRDLITERWDDSVRNAISRGVHITVPYGYQRANGKGSPLVIDPVAAPVVRRIFEERARDLGASQITDSLNADGIPSPRGGRWTRQAVRALLRVRAYAGVAHKGAHELQDAHPAIVPPHEWEAVQRERQPTRQPRGHLLTGLVRCHGCGYSMGRRDDGKGTDRYGCNRHHSGIDCPAPTSCKADTLDGLAEDWFLARYGDLNPEPSDATNPKAAATGGTLARARGEYETWRDDGDLRAVIGDADYRAGLIARKQSVADAERAHAEALRESRTDALAVSRALWETLDTAERHELMRTGLDAIVLRRARSTHAPLTERVEPIWAGELEHDGTRSGIAAAVREWA